ncbi:MAG: serine/threonine-protein kinase [Caldilineaceae bacterium]
MRSEPFVAASGQLTGQFGRYLILDGLGVGAVAEVYRARTPEGRKIALKILNESASLQPRIRQLLRNEYEIMNLLRLPGVIQAIDFGEVGTRLYLAMEMAEGQSLEVMLHPQKTLGESVAITLTKQIATTLHQIHARSIVHRDIKSGNVIITSDGRALLIDFGAAINRNKQVDNGSHAIFGTPAFLAPEQIRNSATVDGRADLYSLGVILYRMISGRKPFYGNRDELLEAQLHALPPPPSEFTHVSPALEALILRMLAKEPDQRYQTGVEVVDALDHVELTPYTPPPSIGKRLFGWLRNNGNNEG